MPDSSDEFYRIQKLPPYVFAVINEMRAKARAAQIDVIDLGMGNPDGATPRIIVNKLIEASRNARNHRYSQSRGIPKLREEITRRYQANYSVTLDPDKEANLRLVAFLIKLNRYCLGTFLDSYGQSSAQSCGEPGCLIPVAAPLDLPGLAPRHRSGPARWPN